MNVRENMGFALKLRKMDKDEINRRVEEAARILSIEPFLNRKPKALSGGQRQRVALGRAIVREPKAFLMDEPLSNLDAKLRVQMRTEIAKLHNRIGTTTIYVTHDQTEAMTMAERIVVLKDGVVQQVAPPQNMYDHPENLFVAGFIGSPATNFIRARLEGQNGGMAVTFGSTRLPLERDLVSEAEGHGFDLGSYAGKGIILGIRPEHMEDARLEEAAALSSAEESALEIEPQVIESMGSEKYLYFGLPKEQVAHPGSEEEMTNTPITGQADGEAGGGSAEEPGDMMVARVSAESRADRGEKMRLAIDASQLHLFDPESEVTILWLR
jgi:multiple sugar transport system ATP-binding protein